MTRYFRWFWRRLTGQPVLWYICAYRRTTDYPARSTLMLISGRTAREALLAYRRLGGMLSDYHYQAEASYLS